MKNKKIKYSIILPIYNGMEYLPTCISTIINQNYNDYELIISDDCSTDGTRKYLDSLKNKQIKVIHQEKNLGAIDNFSEAIKHASGEWLMFLGVDDGLQDYFFSLADKLTEKCNENNLRIIASSRAYFFWNGAAELYGDTAVGYSARKEFTILSSKKELCITLLGGQTYFELPQMYSNSLFHYSLVTEAKEKQEGAIFSTIPPDANLAATALSLESKYLKSFIPLGWVGTSSSRTEYVGKNSDDNGFISAGISYKKVAGSPLIGSTALYLWNALLCTSSLRGGRENTMLNSRLFKILLFSSVCSELRKKGMLKKRSKQFFDLLSYNDISLTPILILSRVMGSVSFMLSFYRKTINKIKNILMPSYKVYIKRDYDVCMFKESHKISKQVGKFFK